MNMKQVLLFGFALVITAVGIGFYMRPSPSSLVKETDKATTTVVFTLYRTNGEVFYRKQSDNNFSSLSSASIELPNNTTVKTTSGKATVLLVDKSLITLKENTEIIVSLEEKGYSIQQMFGKTYHRVETLLTGKTYEVRTPTTLAAVRGTKFGVSYDMRSKETKIAVTEHKVAVEEIDTITGTTTREKEETYVEEGKTVTVKDKKDSSLSDVMIMSNTKDEKEMQQLINEEVAMDEVYEDIKQSGDMDEFKKKVEEVIIKEEVSREEASESAERELTVQKKEEIKVENKKAENTKETTVKNEETERVPTVPVKKISEEDFFTQFEPMFIKLFYVDEEAEPCSFRGTADDRVKQITSLADESGYPLTSTTKLNLFAKDIATYCATKDKALYLELQKRFDEEYPYQ